MNLKRIASTTKMSHEEWLAWRTKGIGGSDAASICGLSPFASPISVWMNKTGRSGAIEDNEAMRQGRDFEEYVADRFCEATGKKVHRVNSILVHPEHDWMLANVDRLVLKEDAGFEAKTTSVYNNDQWTDGKVPAQYQLQCHHYMAVTGAARWYIGCLVLNKAFYWACIERDEDIIANLISIEKKFWFEHVIAGEMPAPDGSDDSEEVIKELFSAEKVDVEGSVSVKGEEWGSRMNRYYTLDEMLEKMKKEKEAIKQEIMLVMGTTPKLYIEGESAPITWKPVSTDRIDTKLFKKEQPELAKQYIKTTESRRFVIPDRD